MVVATIQMMKTKSCRQLWLDYGFLTQEMKRFISLMEWPILEDLERQRELLQQELNCREVDDFRSTPEGIQVISEILEAQKEVELQVGIMKRRMEQQRQRTGAYDGVGAMPIRVEREV